MLGDRGAAGRLALRLVVGLLCVAAVVTLTVRPPSLLTGRGEVESTPVVSVAPGTGEGPARGTIRVVEVGSRPDYRVVALDLGTGRVDPIFVVPERGVISSIATTPDGSTLVLGYAVDYDTAGTGLYLLDLGGAGETPAGGDDLVPLLPERRGVTFTDLTVSPDGATVWATRSAERVEVVAVDLATGALGARIEGAAEPAVGAGWLAYLVVDDDGARRGIAVLDEASGATATIEVLDGRHDLAHLVADPDRDRLLVAALEPSDEPSIQIGEPAGAHGSHEGPARWLTVEVATGEVWRLADHEPIAGRDATLLAGGGVAVSTADGVVVIADGGQPALVFSSRRLTEMGR